jgi:RNA polymerase-binding transcription factor
MRVREVNPPMARSSPRAKRAAPVKGAARSKADNTTKRSERPSAARSKAPVKSTDKRSDKPLSKAPKKSAKKPPKAASRAATTSAKGSRTASTRTHAPAKAGARTAVRRPAPAAKPSARVAKRRRPAVDKRTLAVLRAQLERERENLQSQADALEEERRRLAADRDSADDSFTEESGEGATTTMEQEKDLSLAANVANLLEKVEGALARMDAGTYGFCIRCGNPIGKPRLLALPHAALCISCKQREEHRFV